MQTDPGKLAALTKTWTGRIAKRLQARSDGWGRDAEYAEAAYSLDDTTHGRTPDFNILFSNVETIVPAVFNSTPVPDIRERHRQGDQLARLLADALENVVALQVDDSALTSEVEDVVRDSAVSGRGLLRLRFTATTDDAGGISDERVRFEACSWRDYLEGPAPRFSLVPWIAFRHRLSKDEADRVTDPEVYQAQQVEGSEEERRDREDVWEIWCKKSRSVIFMRDADGRILRQREDPLGLKGFFPICKPLQPVTMTGRRDPVVPYKLYRKLADELDTATRRINAIIKGLKVRGIIITGADDIEKLAEADDNTLVTAANLEGLGTIGLEKAVMWWPVEQSAAVLRYLYEFRELTKQSIYEITGISDIVRGASDARETATAQQVKTQWGALRIRRLQSMVERLVRDAFVMTVELIASKFSPESVVAQSGIDLPPEAFDLLSDPLMYYRVDVESDSTIRGDLTRQKGEMAEFLQGTASFFQVMQPVVAATPAVAGPIISLYAAFARQHNLGRQAEGALDELIEMAKQAAQQPPPGQQDQAAQADMQAKQADAQIKMQELQMKAQESAARLQMDQQRHAADLQLKQADLGLKGQDRQLKALEIDLKGRDLEIRQQEANRKDFEAEVGAAAKADEIDLEREQQRAVAIGTD